MTSASDRSASLEQVRDALVAWESILDHAAVALPALNDEAASAPLKGSGWTSKQALGHLIDSAMVNAQRFVRSQTGRGCGLDYDPDRWVELQGYQSRGWAALVELWLALNRHALATARAIPAAELEKPCQDGATLGWVVADYSRHLAHHLNQIDQGEMTGRKYEPF